MSYEACDKHNVDVTNEACIECRAEEEPTEVGLPLGTAMFSCRPFCSACDRSTFEVRGGIEIVLENREYPCMVLCRECLERLLHLATHNE